MNVALKRMTADDYLAWAGQQTSGRTELVDGLVVAMNAQRIAHVEAKFEVLRALKDAVRGTGHWALGDGVVVRVDDATVYEPDALIYGGERLPPETVAIPAPVVVVEILSPGTKTVDTTKKLEGYFKLASVRDYLIVDPIARTIVHHARDANGSIATAVVSRGVIAFMAINAKLPVNDCFAA
ncbi:MAG: Uma2 family endonuclease [Hyphomicrobium sp.]